MKLELGMRSREIQRDWYGKRGISLHGFYVIAQVAVGEKRIEVLDLWCEDTKQDAWFTQSAFDVGFAWMEKVFPNFQVYLFSGECHGNKNKQLLDPLVWYYMYIISVKHSYSHVTVFKIFIVFHPIFNIQNNLTDQNYMYD